MKFCRLAILVFITSISFISCNKQTDFVAGGVSSGSLKSNITGDCLSVNVNGFFRAKDSLTGLSFADIQIDVTKPGTFDIKSDTVNGFSFRKTGSVLNGLRTIRLVASGKPLSAGNNLFTIQYGNSVCSFNVLVADSASALFSLGGAPTAACTGFTANGTYAAGVPLTAANTVSCKVNVAATGIYSITTGPVNGMTFSASGVFTSTGSQTIILQGSGRPGIFGNFNFTPAGGNSNCTFNITVLQSGGGGGGSTADYSLGGTPGNCTNVVLTGTYMVGITTNSSNTAKVDVTVNTAGSYSLSTPTVNGVRFSASGNFTVTGAQTVTLTANAASPAMAGPFNYVITGATSTCSFTVTYLPPAPPAAFTLSGDPGACTPATVNGVYTAGTALNSSNNIVVQVNVTIVGSYNFSTNLVNGMQFTASGVFTAAGLQNVTLLPTAGSNPVAGGISRLMPMAGSSSCTFDITVAAPSDLVYSFKIGSTTYSGPCSAILIDNGGGTETMNIYDAGSGATMDLNLDNPTGPVTIGFYSGTSSAGKNASIQYMGAITFLAAPGSGLTNLSANITSINSVTRIVQGTFSGTVIDLSATVRTVTNGTFKADY